MESKIITTSLFSKIHYRKYGQGEPLVLIHGFPEDGDLWHKIVPQLAQHFTLFIPDLPGVGNSCDIGNGVSIDELAMSVNWILDEENITQAVIAGHSMGGYIAMSFAAQFPGRLKGLSLVHSTATEDTEDKKEIRRKAIRLLEKGGKEAFVNGMIPNLFSDNFKEHNKEAIMRQINQALEVKAESMISFYNAMINRPNRVEVLTDIAIPVQWIIGQYDTVVPMNVSLQQTTKSNVTFVSIYSDAAHMSMIEQPLKLTNDLKAFCQFCYNC